uniref:AB hydrolase-1 domain-containing protein n=1 Tax=Araucaria cunninghamii TaxID=56994 RepID=A0A0D6QVB1_ARACU
MEAKAHFVLVHGAGFGGWCWYKVTDNLVKTGNTVSPLDMASGGIDPRNADQITTLAEYNQPLTDFIRALPPQDKVILVGHSSGGFNLSLTMEQFPNKIVAAVFLTAFMPLPGTTFLDLIYEVRSVIGSYGDSEFYYARGEENPPTSFKFGRQFLRTNLTQRSPPWDVTLVDSLLKKCPIWQDPISYTKENYGSVPRVYLIAKDDKAIPEELQRKYIAENPPQMVYEIEGSDHCTFFSKPDRLAGILVQIAHKYLYE